MILYVPSEHFFASAIAVDKAILNWALEQKVVITTPATLMFLLSEVDEAWRARAETTEGNEELVALKAAQRSSLWRR